MYVEVIKHDQKLISIMSYVLRNARYDVTIPYMSNFSTIPEKTNSESSGFCVYRPIKYDPYLEYKLIRLSKDNYPRFDLSNIPAKYSIDIRTGLARVWISLRAYYESKRPLLKLRAIELAFKRNGAKTLKRIRWKSLMKHVWYSNFCDEPEWWNDSDIDTYDIGDVGDIFYYKYCFPWEEDCEDYKYAFLPVKQKKKSLEKFRETLKSLLDHWDFNIDFEKEEVLYSMSTSKVLLDSGKTDFLYNEKNYNKLGFARKRSPGLRCVVFVSPEGTRDTIINKSRDLYSIKAIDHLVLELLYKNEKEYLVDKNTNDFIKRYREYHFDSSYVYCRDITKEGITKPRNLLKIMLEELKERCTLFDFVDADFFEHEWLSFDGKTPAGTTRGHGLGMANSLTTLMQIVIFNMVISKFYKQEYTDVAIKPLFLNDDCIFFFKEYNEIIDFFEEYDDTVLTNLGLIRNKSKSFAAKGGVFCECFLPEYTDKKESFKRRECMLPLTATNICHAKSMFTLINLEFMDNYFQEIVTKFGYEFFPDEKDYTPEFGGWIPYKTNRLNLDLIRIEDIYENKFCKAYFACKERTFDIHRRKSKGSVNNFLNIDVKIDDKILKKLNIINNDDLIKKFYIPFYDKNADEEWRKIFKKRRKTYEFSPVFDYRTFCKIVLNETNNFCPPDFTIERKVKIDLYENLFFNYYDYKFPICSALRRLKNQTVEGKPSTLWYLMKEHSEEYLEASNIRKILTSLSLENFVNIYENTYNEGVFLPQNQLDLNDLEESYARPFDITYFYGSLDRLAPILKKEFRPDLSMKETVFGRRLNLTEIIYYNNLNWKIIKLFMDNNLSDEEIPQIMIEFDRLRSETRLEEAVFDINESESDDFDWDSLIKKDIRETTEYEGSLYYNYPTEKELRLYLVDEKFINNVNRSYPLIDKNVPVGKVLKLFLTRNSLSSNLEEVQEMRRIINQELIDLTRDKYPEIHDFLFREESENRSSEEEPDFTGDFDMFG